MPTAPNPLPPRPSAAEPASDMLAGAWAGLAALAMAMGIGRFAFTPVLPLMLEEGWIGIRAGAWLASANYLGYLLGALSAMVWRIPAQRAIRAGLVTIAAVTMAMALPLPLFAWAVLRLIAGVASAWVLISVSAWTMEWTLRHARPQLAGIVFSGVGTGIAGAGCVCIALVAFGAGADAAWLVLGATVLAVCVVIWTRFSSDPQSAAAAPSGAARLPRAGAWRLVLAYGLFGFGYIIPATFLPVMAREALEAGSLFAWSWPVFGAAAALSTLCSAHLVRQFGNRRVWIGCHLTMAAGVAAPLAGATLATVLLAALAVGGTFMVLTQAALQEARRHAGPEATGLIAAMTAAFAAGQILGPLTIGSDSGFSIPLALAAAVLLAGAALLAWPQAGSPIHTSKRSKP